MPNVVPDLRMHLKVSTKFYYYILVGMIVRLSLNQLEKLIKEVVTDEYFPSITVN